MSYIYMYLGYTRCSGERTGLPGEALRLVPKAGERASGGSREEEGEQWRRKFTFLSLSHEEAMTLSRLAEADPHATGAAYGRVDPVR
jgi:hypothetical protein